MQKEVLSVKIPVNLYWRLKNEVVRGQVSNFVEKLIVKELNSQESKLAREYQEAAQNKERWLEAREWEEAQLSDWNKYDNGEENN